MLKDLSRFGRMAVRKAYWTTDESQAAIARRYGITPDEVEGLAQWRLFTSDEVPDWAQPGKPRAGRRRSIMELFAPPQENGQGKDRNGTAPSPDAAEAAPTGRLAELFPAGLPAEPASAPAPEPSSDPDFTDADVVELRETYVAEPGILDSMAEAFEIPRERVVRLLRGEERPEAGGPLYPDLDEAGLLI